LLLLLLRLSFDGLFSLFRNGFALAFEDVAFVIKVNPFAAVEAPPLRSTAHVLSMFFLAASFTCLDLEAQLLLVDSKANFIVARVAAMLALELTKRVTIGSATHAACHSTRMVARRIESDLAEVAVVVPVEES
jgi:hypothetical protein